MNKVTPTGALAASAAEVRACHEANRAAWNEGAARYTEEIEDTIAFLRAGKSNLIPRRILGRLPQAQTGVEGAAADDLFDDRAAPARKGMSDGRASV
jgi:hypothetical protein